MEIRKFFFVSLFFLICLAAVNADGQTKTYHARVQEKPGTTSLENLFKGEVKQNLEKLFGVDWELQKRQDNFVEVKQKLEETQETLSYQKTLFEKEKEAGVRMEEYITKLKSAYDKWEKLQADIKDWTTIEECLPTETWTDLESGQKVLQEVQQLKSQAEAQMREVEAEHNVYASRKEQLKKGGKTFEQTHDKVKEETLSKLQSTIQKLKAEEKDLREKLEKLEKSRRTQLGLTVTSWTSDKKEDVILDNLVWMNLKPLSKTGNAGLLSSNLDPAKLKEEVKDKFTETIQFLVENYEEKINGRTEELDGKISKIREDILQDTVQYKKQQNYLYNTRYSLVNTTRYENPLQKENALLDVINAITKVDPKDLNKRFAEKLKVKVKLLKAIIVNSYACKIAKNVDFSRGVDNAALRFKNDVLKEIQQPVSTPLIRDFVSTQVKEVTEKHHRNFQKMMAYFNRMEQCMQALRKVENTVTNVDQWSRRMRR